VAICRLAQTTEVYLTPRLAKHVAGFGADFIDRAGLARHIEQLGPLRMMSDCPPLGCAAAPLCLFVLL
jgi:hypothetical protein